MLTVLKPYAEKPLQPLARVLKHVNPNWISVLGLLFPVLFFILVLNKLYYLALLTFIFNWVDLLDGMVARQGEKVTPFGGFLDSTIDRVSDFVVIAAFGFAGIVSWNIILPLLMLSYLISYIRSRTELAAKGDLKASVGIIERTERLLLVFIGLLLYAFFPNTTIFGQNIMSAMCIVLLVLSAVTVIQRIDFAYKKL
jgi:archaetidylinositol phosphate synthase